MYLRAALDIFTQPDPLTPESILDAKAVIDVLEQALATLPPVQQRILDGQYGLTCEQRTLRELADELGLTVSLVASAKVTALKSLRRNHHISRLFRPSRYDYILNFHNQLA